MVRIGLLTSGGDCQALNATMRGIVKTVVNLSTEPVEIYGFEDGYQGMIYKRYRKMHRSTSAASSRAAGPSWARAARPSSASTRPRPTVWTRSPP